MKQNKKINNIHDLLEVFSQLKAMVIGDVMIDSYIFGKVERISPEAPVPVVHITGREMRPGGAANVAINLKALGASTILCSVTGNDESGEQFKKLLSKEGLTSEGIIQSTTQTTTVKTRVIGNQHQLLRVDEETLTDIADNTEKDFIESCLQIIKTQQPDVIIFEDYDKGVITPGVISEVIKLANQLNIPVTVDPKKKNFSNYKNVTLFKPNLHELRTGTGLDINKTDIVTLKSAGDLLSSHQNINTVMVTLSEAGVFINSKENANIFPAHIRSISDVSGAGDTVISVASLCLAAGLNNSSIAKLSNLAGGLVCEEVGVVPISKIRLIAEVEKNPELLD